MEEKTHSSSPFPRNSSSREPPNENLKIGVSFRHLHTYGFSTSARYQTTFLSALLRPFQAFQRSRQRIQILHDLEGLIRAGELDLVLGRPGSGCSTFLKTLTGETHGFKLSDDSEVNYQGE